MNKATSILIAAVAALTLSGGAFAQSNNSLARPSVTSPVSAAGDGYGTPGTTNSDSGKPAGSANSGMSNSANGSTPPPTVWPSNNSLARPSVVSPAAGQ
jgi:hypothetical protein